MDKRYRIAVIPGDDIGREVMPEGLRVLEAVARAHGIAFTWDELPWSCDYYAKHGRMMPEDWFEPAFRGHSSSLRVINYPRPEGEVERGLEAWRRQAQRLRDTWAEARIDAVAAKIAAIMPDREHFAAELKAEAYAPFPILTDIDNGYAMSLNLAFWVGAEMQELMTGAGWDGVMALTAASWRGGAGSVCAEGRSACVFSGMSTIS